MDTPLTKKEIVLERNSVNGPPYAFRDLRTMLAARNLNYGGGSAKHDTGVHFSPVFSACIGQPMMNKTAECKTRVRQRAMWAKRGIITIQKGKKKEISPAPLNMKIPFIIFRYRGVWLSARLIKGKVVTSFSSFYSVSQVWRTTNVILSVSHSLYWLCLSFLRWMTLFKF